MAEIDWANPGGLNEMWKAADAVVYVRIVGTGPVRSECPSSDFELTATVMDILKVNGARPIGKTVAFMQENCCGEPATYRIGQEMFVFLIAAPQGFRRLAGPQGVFLIYGHEVLGFQSLVQTHGVTPSDFLAKLRALAREPQLR